MSDSLEILEITDSSICIVSPEVENAGNISPNTTKTKRQLSDTDVDERSAKKICTAIEDKVVAELIVSGGVTLTLADCANECCIFREMKA